MEKNCSSGKFFSHDRIYFYNSERIISHVFFFRIFHTETICDELEIFDKITISHVSHKLHTDFAVNTEAFIYVTHLNEVGTIQDLPFLCDSDSMFVQWAENYLFPNVFEFQEGGRRPKAYPASKLRNYEWNFPAARIWLRK